ncbi:MAG: uracil-DNA glycosylase [Myxococcota bacterium]
MPERAPRPDCLHCVHYFVTWEPAKPRGCRAYAFKSEDLPSDVVFESSGEPCRLFERKPERKPPARLVR